MKLNNKTYAKVEALVDREKIIAEREVAIEEDKILVNEVVSGNKKFRETVDKYASYVMRRVEELKNNSVNKRTYNNTRAEEKDAFEVLFGAQKAEELRQDIEARASADAQSFSKISSLVRVNYNVSQIQAGNCSYSDERKKYDEIIGEVESLIDVMTNDFVTRHMATFLKGCAIKTFLMGVVTFGISWLLILLKKLKSFGEKKREEVMLWYKDCLYRKLLEDYFIGRSEKIGELLAARNELAKNNFGGTYDVATVIAACDNLVAFLPEEFRNSSAIADIIMLIQCGRCDGLKEGYAVVDKKIADRKLERHLTQIEELMRENKAEAKVQTEYLKQSVRIAEKAANISQAQVEATRAQADATRAQAAATREQADAQNRVATNISNMNSDISSIKQRL